MACIEDIGLAIEIRFEAILNEETDAPYSMERLLHIFRETERQMHEIIAHEGKCETTDRARFASAVLHETGPAIIYCKRGQRHHVNAHLDALVTMAKQYRYAQIRKYRQATRRREPASCM